MQTKQQIHELVDRLPESETGAAARFLEFLLAHDEAPIDPEMLKRIDAARAQKAAGVPHAEILREFEA
jgi:methylase of polypeptide subunit release factors